MLIPINHGICRCCASRVGFPIVTSRLSLYPSLAKSELAVCITRSPKGLTRHRCAYLPLFLPRVSLSPPHAPPPFTPCRTSRGIRSAYHVLEHEERFAGRMCAREKRGRRRESKRFESKREKERKERKKDLERNRLKEQRKRRRDRREEYLR